MELDPTDLTLVEAIQADAAQRLEDLAKKVQLAPSSVHERLRRLEREGVIQRWTIAVDAASLGLGVLAYIGIRATKPCSEIVPTLSSIGAIEECHSVAGELSLLLKVRVAHTAGLMELVERLRQIKGIEGTETTIVLQTQFDRPVSIPVPTPPKRTGRRS